MNWMSLALLRAMALTKDVNYQSTSENLFGKVMAAWDATCCIPGHPGGVWWDTPHTQKVCFV